MTRTTRIAPMAADATTSGSVDLGDASLGLVALPSGVTAATLALHGSFDGTTFLPLYDVDGNAITITATDSAIIPLDPVWTYAVPAVRFVGNTAQLTSSITITCGLVPVT